MLLDVLGADPTFGVTSREALRDARRRGRVLACDVVWAETAAWFPSGEEADRTLAKLEIVYSPLDSRSSLEAARAWRSYRDAGGSRQRVIADFLIGAHALMQAEVLLTRDRGFYRSRFGALEVIDPGLAS